MELIRQKGIDYLLCDQPVQVYYRQNLIASGQGCLDLGCLPELQPVVEVVTGTKHDYVSRRSIPECGITNLRDLGGYQTVSGLTIRYGLLYRGAALLTRSADCQRKLDQLHFKTIVDLRSQGEIDRQGRDYVSGQAKWLHCSGLKTLDDPATAHHYDFDYLLQSGHLFTLKDYMSDMYRTMALANPAFQTLIELMSQHQTPLYFHCSAGKDRTGLGAALLLLCLGVDEKTVMDDYLLSNVCRQEANERMLARIPPCYREDTRPLYEVHASYLTSALQTIKEAYGSYDAYFLQVHHLSLADRRALQKSYCY